MGNTKTTVAQERQDIVKNRITHWQEETKLPLNASSFVQKVQVHPKLQASQEKFLVKFQEFQSQNFGPTSIGHNSRSTGRIQLKIEPPLSRASN